MRPVLTAAETQALDRATEERGVSIELLMERAGLAVARAAVGVAGGAYGRRAVVVAGKGNNGGDGLVAARYLSRWGMGVVVLLLAPPDEFREPAAANLGRLDGIRTVPFDPGTLGRELGRADVAVDALFGSGFRGVAEGAHAAAIELLNAGGAPVVAVDVPSGVEGDTALVRGPAVLAAATVTFGAAKVGNVLFPGAAHAGEVIVADIGFPPDLLVADVHLVEDTDIRELLPVRSPEGHKRRSGVVLVVAGSRHMTGAPSLVARGAYRAGAGLVRIAVPAGILPIVQSLLAETTFRSLAEGTEGSIAEDALDERDLASFDAVAIGPGLSTDGGTPAFVRRLVRTAPVPVVVDADAINAFAGRPGEVAETASEIVLTPHTGEFARLFGMSPGEVPEDRIGLARKAAAETRSVVLLKGARTIVATPGGEVRVNPTGSPALSTGGTGDVLTGAIAAFIGRGLAAADAATVAAYVHGLAGELLEDGAVAGDVAEALPEAVRRVRG
ncbi:MAG TPA: NAD(P)H-hydrate dehydratase [Actinomycetota bacterium]|nr:NAD(P)H-hydrate dehydratase [Actinomycetota bacterium]